MKVCFKLADGIASLRHALPGGRELAIDGQAVYTTDEPAEIAALDRHPSARRAKAVGNATARKPRKKTAKAAPAKETSA